MLELKDYQKKDLKRIQGMNGKVILGYEMGMGKSCVSITYTAKNNIYPLIIVCEAGMKATYKDEVKLWAFSAKNIVTILNGNAQPIPKVDNLIVIINYDVLGKWEEELIKIKPKGIIFDEFTAIENPKSIRARASLDLCNKVQFKSIILTSGTPIKKDQRDLYIPLRILSPMDIYSEKHFGKLIKANRVKYLLNKYLIRRLKKDHLKLPPKTRQVISVNISNMKEYKSAENDFRSWLRSQKEITRQTKIHIFTKIEKLKQIAAQGKHKALVNWTKTQIGKPGKIIGFFAHTDPLINIQKEFSDMSTQLNGSMNIKQREIAKKEFIENPKIRLMWANIKAAGKGHTLVAADKVVMCEMPWTSVDCDQCEDRIHRIGQKAKKVSAIYFIAKGTIEERIAQIIDKKRSIFNKVIDGTAVKKDELLTELVKYYRN